LARRFAPAAPSGVCGADGAAGLRPAGAVPVLPAASPSAAGFAAASPVGACPPAARIAGDHAVDRLRPERFDT
jgi:hypothetical protein